MSLANNPNNLYQLRPATVADIPFITNSWLRSYRNNCRNIWGVPSELYYQGQHEVVERIFASANLKAFVACNPEDDSQIFGYIIATTPVEDTLCVHWVYCKQPLRKFGVGKGLFLALKPTSYAHTYYSHRTTEAIDKLALKYDLLFNPFSK